MKVSEKSLELNVGAELLELLRVNWGFSKAYLRLFAGASACSLVVLGAIVKHRQLKRVALYRFAVWDKRLVKGDPP
jgi:hypothetical protein